MRRPFNRDRRPFPVYNNSGEAVPPYACMELDYNFESGDSAIEEIDNEPVLWVKKPTSSGEADPSRVVFNTENAIAIGGYGTAQIDPFILALWDGTPGSVSPGDTVGPTDAEWKISSDGTGFTVKTHDSAQAIYESSTERTIYIETTLGGEGDAKVVQLDGTLSARSGTTLGSATASVFTVSGTTISDSGNNITVLNLDTKTVPSGQYVLAVRESGGSWIAQHPGIVDLRLSGSDLQYTYDGSTWATWHTAGDTCP